MTRRADKPLPYHVSFAPWRVAVHFWAPCVYYTPTILDGLVAYALNRAETAREGRPSYCGPGWKREGIWETLRTLIWQDSNCSVCTELQPEGPDRQYRESVKKRFDARCWYLIDWEGAKRRRINLTAAPFRAWDKPMPAHAIRGGWFGFIGDGAAVLALLQQHVVGIGKDINAGYGWVDRWDLTPAPDLTRERILSMRPVPVHLAERYGIAGRRELRAWRPAYWSRTNMAECVVPA